MDGRWYCPYCHAEASHLPSVKAAILDYADHLERMHGTGYPTQVKRTTA